MNARFFLAVFGALVSLIFTICCVAFGKWGRMGNAWCTFCPVALSPKIRLLSGCCLGVGAANSRAGSEDCTSTPFHKSLWCGYLMVDVSPEDAVFPKSQEANKLLQFKNESIYWSPSFTLLMLIVFHGACIWDSSNWILHEFPNAKIVADNR